MEKNYFEGIPSPIGAILILTPLIFELSNFNISFDLSLIAPYLTILIALLLISKIPTFSFKKISIQPKVTVFILFGIGISLICIMFFTFETLFIFSLSYILTIQFHHLPF